MSGHITIVTGFLGSGKTSFINRLVSSIPDHDRVLVLLGELGEVDLDRGHPNICVHEMAGQDYSATAIVQAWREHRPDHLILEHNGVRHLSEMLVQVEDALGSVFGAKLVLHVVGAPEFEVLSRNIGAILADQLSHSDAVLITRGEDISEPKRGQIYARMRSEAPRRALVTHLSDDVERVALKRRRPRLTYRQTSLGFALAVLALSVVLGFGQGLLPGNAARQLAIFNTLFLGIMVEALPFILIGLLASALLLVVVPSDALLRVLPRNQYLGIITAAFAGLVFPVCDCAVIPVANRLIRKGVPVPVATTYMMASPIVDPVVIMATIYAFPGRLDIVAFRVLLGLLVAITIGILVSVYSGRTTPARVYRERLSDAKCQCGFCGEAAQGRPGVLGRLQGVVRHIETEFFAIIPFVIMGAAVSGLIHTFVPQTFMSQLGSSRVTALVIMMVLAYLMSMCSTSDAFVGRSFIGPLGLGPVFGFLVFGPMMDLKNTLIMLGLFERRFVIRLAATAFIVCAAYVLIMTPIFF